MEIETINSLMDFSKYLIFIPLIILAILNTYLHFKYKNPIEIEPGIFKTVSPSETFTKIQWILLGCMFCGILVFLVSLGK